MSNSTFLISIKILLMCLLKGSNLTAIAYGIDSPAATSQRKYDTVEMRHRENVCQLNDNKTGSIKRK